jgi:UPF0755 protein
MAKRKKGTLLKKIMWSIVVVLAVTAAGGAYLFYKEFLQPNVKIAKPKDPYLYIPTGSTFEDVVRILTQQNLLVNEKTFRWTAGQMKYINSIKPGKYLLKPKMNNKQLIALLRSGEQTPVLVIFNNIRTKDQLAQKVSEQIEAPAMAILNLLEDHDYTAQLGFTPQNILSLFIPDTYEFYWNTSADRFIRRMKTEYNKFWTDSITRKAREIGFTPVEVSVLASIVQQETRKDDEKSIIAGVYINRLKKGWRLEADPTLVFALGDYSVNRVLNAYKQINSPYNTYMYAGLPPGPICLPTIASLKAVLNYRKHNYMYFCAREDFSGYHTFAATYDQHLANAHRFQKALDKRGIKS